MQPFAANKNNDINNDINNNINNNIFLNLPVHEKLGKGRAIGNHLLSKMEMQRREDQRIKCNVVKKIKTWL